MLIKLGAFFIIKIIFTDSKVFLHNFSVHISNNHIRIYILGVLDHHILGSHVFDVISCCG